LLEKRHFTYCVGLGIVVAVTSQMAERTDYNKLLFGISIGALVVNLAADMWAFTPTRVFEDNREFRVFKTVFYSTGFVSPYAAACVLLSEKFAPYLVAMMSLTCLIITLSNFYDMLKSYATTTDAKPCSRISLCNGSYSCRRRRTTTKSWRKWIISKSTMAFCYGSC
ncbi:hypothetical protein Tco_1559875, partial [Tanacetum coccineum]